MKGDVSWEDAGVDLAEWFDANGWPPEELVQRELRKMNAQAKPCQGDLFQAHRSAA